MSEPRKINIGGGHRAPSNAQNVYHAGDAQAASGRSVNTWRLRRTFGRCRPGQPPAAVMSSSAPHPSAGMRMPAWRKPVPAPVPMPRLHVSAAASSSPGSSRRLPRAHGSSIWISAVPRAASPCMTSTTMPSSKPASAAVLRHRPRPHRRPSSAPRLRHVSAEPAQSAQPQRQVNRSASAASQTGRTIHRSASGQTAARSTAQASGQPAAQAASAAAAAAAAQASRGSAGRTRRRGRCLVRKSGCRIRQLRRRQAAQRSWSWQKRRR